MPDLIQTIVTIEEPSDLFGKVVSRSQLIFALRFIFMHELMHIHSGHVDLHEEVGGLRMNYEKTPGATDRLTGIDFQAFELHCDINAFRILQKMAILLAPTWPLPPETHDDGLKSIAVTALTSSVFVVFNLLREFGASEDIDDYKHPSAQVRLRAIFQNTKVRFLEAGWKESKTFAFSMSYPAQFVYKSFCAVNRLDRQFNFVEKINSPEAEKSILKLSEHYKELYDRTLHNYAWIKMEQL